MSAKLNESESHGTEKSLGNDHKTSFKKTLSLKRVH